MILIIHLFLNVPFFREDYIGDTEIICNPHEYIDEKDNGFIKELMIEL